MRYRRRLRSRIILSFFLLGFAPFVWGLLASVLLGVAVSLRDRPPRPELRDRFFGPQE